MPRFTVYLTTHNYERWDHVEAASEEELQERLDEEDYDEVLGEPNKEDCTSAEWDIYPEESTLKHAPTVLDALKDLPGKETANDDL